MIIYQILEIIWSCSSTQNRGSEETGVDWGKLKKVHIDEKQMEAVEEVVENKKTERVESQPDISKRQAPVLVSI